MSLLCLRTTHIDPKLPLPADELLGRAIQDNLQRKIPRDALNEEVAPTLEERQELQIFYHARQRPGKTPGQRVTIQDQTTLKWKPTEVRKKLARVPRSHAVATTTGRELRRTRTQSNIVIEPDTDEQTVLQTPTNPTGTILVPSEIQASALQGSHVIRNGRISKPPERLDM